jgi:hypothetical protein
VVDSCEHGNEPSDFIKGRELLDELLKDSASWNELLQVM